MIVDFDVQHGSEITHHRGLCLEVSPTEITIITPQKKFKTYPKENQQIKDVIPTHTRMRHSYEQGQFHDLTIDELRELFQKGKYTKDGYSGESVFSPQSSEGIEHKVKKLSLSYPNSS